MDKENRQKYAEDFFKNITERRAPSPDLSATGFTGIMMAYLGKEGCQYVRAGPEMHNAFCDLKRSLDKDNQFLMEDVNFMFYSHRGYFSDDLESALTMLQMSRFIAYINPELKNIEIILQPGDAQLYIDSRIQEMIEKNENMNREDLEKTFEGLASKLKEKIGISNPACR